MVEQRATFRTEPRIVEAWVAGARLTPTDGSPARESTDIVLALEPPIERGHAEEESRSCRSDFRRCRGAGRAADVRMGAAEARRMASALRARHGDGGRTPDPPAGC